MRRFLSALLVAVAVACERSATAPPIVPPSPPPDSSVLHLPFPAGPTPIHLPGTPDGGGIESDAFGPWQGWPVWLAYNVADTALFLTHSVNGLVFSMAVHEPMASTAATDTQVSDPELVQVGDSVWFVLLRNTRSQNWLVARASGDGARWTPERPITPRVAWAAMLGPALRAEGGVLHLWSVNAAPKGCSGPTSVIEHRTAADGFAAADTVPLAWPGYTPWHLDVVAVRSVLWLLVNAHVTPGGCARGHVFVAVGGTDGHDWTALPSPIDPPGLYPGGAYRSTLQIVADTATVWWSGIAADGAWRVVGERLPVDSLLARASH